TEKIPALLQEMQEGLLVKATEFRERYTVRIDTLEAFKQFFASEEGGGFALCHWNEDPVHEAKVKEELNVTIRCIPLNVPEETCRCFFTGESSRRRVIFAKAY